MTQPMQGLGEQLPGLIDCYAGPDGIGKTTIVDGLVMSYPELVVLHGTDLDSWRRRHPDLYDERLIPDELPDPDQILEKIDVVTGTAVAIAARGYHVAVDGHPAAKTAVNIAAKLITVGGMEAGTPVDELLDDSPLAERFQALAELRMLQIFVDMPTDMQYSEAGDELQRRISRREGGRSRWDPQDSDQSQRQLLQARNLAAALRQRGHMIDRIVAA